ncbi:MAG TPA: DUF5615 family PIN-like protein [Candidatus Acidoferrum sp.]|nr:DUF5615 family PIN-like protein [Candidatus Acidoferrum sp.]
MKFLAHESCAKSIILAPRVAEHDVLSIAATMQGITDEQVLARAASENRILITEGRDFGESVYAQSRSSVGVILVRIEDRARNVKPPAVIEAVNRFGSRLARAFTVVQAGRIRISDRP